MEQPYIVTERVVVDRKYNPNYGDDRICKCGHEYYRHFDSYEDMEAVGCKYCGCWDFTEEGLEKTNSAGKNIEPSGATHYIVGRYGVTRFYKLTNGVFWCGWFLGQWIPVHMGQNAIYLLREKK